MKHTIPVAIAILALAAAPAAASLPADEETSYGYLRTVEGPGRVVQAASGARIDVEANYPVLAGDLLEVDPGGRLEVSLPDFNIVRLAGGSELLLTRLALSADTGDTATALRLLRGEVQLLINDYLPVDERPRLDTANATVYFQGSGVYRVATDGYGWTEVVVRRGFAEIATEAGSSVVRSGEQAWVEGGRWPRIGIDQAGGLDDLERWAALLDGELAPYAEAPVEDHLAYSAAPLSRHGTWVTDDGYRAWRPAVAAEWRPYEAGYWLDSPSGMVWVSSEPWGWVTYHYGSWVPSLRYGWVWRPGYQFAPAWVYWYWGPSYVAWVPVGYYSSYYRHYDRGYRFGIHGWAGGGWGIFADWTFCSSRDYRRRDLRHHVHRGHQLARHTRSFGPERGLISTDSRLETRQRSRPGYAGRDGDSLPDVTPFVARQRELTREVSERVFSERRAVPRSEVWERSAAPRPNGAGSRAVEGNQDGPRGQDAWRSQSGRVRSGNPPGGRTATPRNQAPPPGARDGSQARWWQDRPDAVAPRGRGAAVEGARPTPVAPGAVSQPGTDRSSVARRVWEGIRDRQYARPSVVPPTAATPGARPPAAVPRSSPSTSPRPAPGAGQPAVQPRSAPSGRQPTARPGQAPSQRPPEAQRAEPPRRAPSADRRSEPPNRSSASRGSSPSRHQSSARSGDGGSSNRSSSASRSSNRRSSEGSSGGRSARRRPPG